MPGPPSWRTSGNTCDRPIRARSSGTPPCRTPRIPSVLGARRGSSRTDSWISSRPPAPDSVLWRSVEVEGSRRANGAAAQERLRAAGTVRDRLERDRALRTAPDSTFETGEVVGRLRELSAAATTCTHDSLRFENYRRVTTRDVPVSERLQIDEFESYVRISETGMTQTNPFIYRRNSATVRAILRELAVRHLRHYAVTSWSHHGTREGRSRTSGAGGGNFDA